jgi:DNA-binding transcriptional LysR family regulator
MLKNLDIDLLRTFVAIVDYGGFSQAGRHLHKTQSAISLQMKRLEDQAGSNLFHKIGRRRMPTEAGELLLNYARRILSLNDEATSILKPDPLQGHLRFGVTQDFADRGLATVLVRFTNTHPAIRLDVRVDASYRLKEGVANDELDMVVAFQEPGESGDVLGRLALSWIASSQFKEIHKPPLRLVLFESPCFFRDRVINTLEQSGISWRVVYTSPSLPGILAAVEAGLGVTARLSYKQQSTIPELPSLQPVELAIYKNPQANREPMEALENITREHIQSTLRSSYC